MAATLADAAGASAGSSATAAVARDCMEGEWDDSFGTLGVLVSVASIDCLDARGEEYSLLVVMSKTEIKH